MDCEICGRTLYWCNGHGPTASGSGVPVVAAYAGIPDLAGGAGLEAHTMSDYTPTTALVRHNWGAYGAPREEFDRWLAAHDAEVRASVLADQGEPEWGWQYGREAMFVKDGSRYDDDLRFDSEETR